MTFLDTTGALRLQANQLAPKYKRQMSAMIEVC